MNCHLGNYALCRIPINVERNYTMAVVNSMESIVEVALSELLKEDPECCTCEHCMNDMMCLALNALPPKYVSSEKGALFSKISNAMAQQRSIDVRVACINALEFVKGHPHHPKQDQQ